MGLLLDKLTRRQWNPESSEPLPFPRVNELEWSALLEILLLCVSASLSGYEEWDEIVDSGVVKLAWLNWRGCVGICPLRRAFPRTTRSTG